MARHWYDFYLIIRRGIEQGAFHKGVTKGILSLVPKEGDGRKLNNWQPITFFIVICNVFAKTLQRMLQPSDVISPKHRTILALQFIMDNVVLMQDILQWAKASKQLVVFLKLYFLRLMTRFSSISTFTP